MCEVLVYEQGSGNLKILCSVKESMKKSLRSVSIPADVSIIGRNVFMDVILFLKSHLSQEVSYSVLRNMHLLVLV
jgi:hypothetical protein